MSDQEQNQGQEVNLILIIFLNSRLLDFYFLCSFVYHQISARELERIEEAKLKAKYPGGPTGAGRPGGHSSFLQKRLAKGVNFTFNFVWLFFDLQYV